MAADALATLLAKLQLEGFEEKLRDFGAETPGDLADVKDAELGNMGLTKLQVRNCGYTS